MSKVRKKIRDGFDESLPHDQFIEELFERMYQARHWYKDTKLEITEEEKNEIIQYCIDKEDMWNNAPNKSTKFSYFSRIIKGRIIGYVHKRNKQLK